MGDNGKNLKQKQARLGELALSNEGYMMKIIEYNNANDIIIEFQDKYKAKTRGQYINFKKGKFKNPYHPSVFNIGYIGEGKYKVSENEVITRIYNTWVGMLRRCYDPYTINKQPTYRDCIVCEEWRNFQNFAEWYEENYYEVEDETMCLDKDILCKGNKIYSPKSCVFVPNRINCLFTKRQNYRGEYPIGVSYVKRNNKLQSSCFTYDKGDIKGHRKFLGYFPLNKPFQAFYTYKQFKENYIKQVANEYKDLIPRKLYNALYEWRVEIND